MEVTKKKAAELLNVSQKEIERRIKKGELEARKKSQSKYADWIITIPDVTTSPEEEAKFVEETKSEEEAKLDEEIKSEEKTKLEEESKFEEEVKLEEETKPEEKTKPEEEVKFEEETKPEEETKSEEEAKLEEEPKEAMPKLKRLREHRKEQEGKSDKWWF